MAKGANIKLGNGNGAKVTPVTPTKSTENEEIGMVEQTAQAFENQSDIEDQNNTVTEPDDVDEDLKVNVRSSVEDKRRAYEREIRKLGRAHATGALSTMGLGEVMLEGTCADAFTIAELPGGHRINDALTEYTLFRSQSKTWSDADRNNSFNQNVKKYENIIQLGMTHKDEAQAWFGAVKDIAEENMSKSDIRKSMKLADAGLFEVVIDVVREQLARDTAANAATPLLEDDEIFKAMMKADSVAKEASAILELAAAFKALNRAQDGVETKSKKGNFKGLNDDKLRQIIEDLQNYGFNDLNPADIGQFRAATVKQKKTRRTIKPISGVNNNGNGGAASQHNTASGDTSADFDDQQEAEMQGDQE